MKFTKSYIFDCFESFSYNWVDYYEIVFFSIWLSSLLKKQKL